MIIGKGQIMGKTFLQEFEDAVRRMEAHQDSERDRVYRETVRDDKHAFRNVEIKKPDPWKHSGGLTI